MANTIMISLISIVVLQCLCSAHKESQTLHGESSNTDVSVLTSSPVLASSPLLTNDYMRSFRDGNVTDNQRMSILKLLKHLQWDHIIVFYDHSYRNTALQLLNVVLGLTTIYDLEDIHTNFTLEHLLQQLYKKFSPTLHFLLLSDCYTAFDILHMVDNIDLASNRTTEYRHHSYWIAACYSPHQHITRLPYIHHLENLVLIVSDKTGIARVYQLMTTPRERFFSQASCLMQVTEDVFPNTRYGLNNRTLMVSTIEYEPFVIKKGDTFEGYLIDILDAMAWTLNFSYKIAYTKDGRYGAVSVDKIWNGLIGQLQRREVDLAVSDLTIHGDREDVMDFLYPPVFNWVDDIMYKLHTEELGNWKTDVKPFSAMVLCVLSITLVVSTLIVYILTKWEDAHIGKERNQNTWKRWTCTLADTFFYMFGILSNRGLQSNQKNQSTRLLLFTWGFFSVIIAACYSAKLVAALAYKKPELPFTCLGELVRQDEYKWGFKSGSMREHIFKHSRSGNMRKAWEGILKFNKTDREVLSQNYSVHAAKVKAEKYATLMLRHTIEKYRRHDCDIQYVGQDVIWHQIGIGVPTDYPLKKELENILSSIADSGLLDIWWRRWSRLEDDPCIEERQVATLSLSDVAFIFYLPCGGLGVAFVVLVFELVVRHSKNKSLSTVFKESRNKTKDKN